MPAMTARLVIVASLLLVAGVAAGPSGYACPDSCQGPDCQCASSSPPGGLSPQDTPQFIVLTNDDSVTRVSYPIIRAVTDKNKNRNGCPMPATWFVQTQYTEPNLIRQLYMDNHEIATHTITHPSLPSASEIVGARTWLNQSCNVPLEKMKGFRAPFLLHDDAQRTILMENGFLYDSSMPEQFGGGMASPAGNRKIWPFTMDYGVPIDCTVGTGSCSTSESHPGLWEFPLWAVQDESGAVVASMDPVGDNFAQYKLEFERSYNGNRAPVGIFLHAGLVDAFGHTTQLQDFLEWAVSSHDNVWVVTISEVLRWMENPVPASQYELECPTPTDMKIPAGHICFEPAVGCGQGTWDSKTCKCSCMGGLDVTANGYCLDDEGSCSIAKTYDPKTLHYKCPSQTSWEEAPPTWVAAPAPAPSDDFGMGPVDTTYTDNTTTISFAFYITGTNAQAVQANKATAICQAVSRVALENATHCEVTTVTDVAGTQETGARVYVEVAINSTTPDNANLALKSAAQYGTMAASLKSAGVTFDSVAPLASATPTPSPPAATPPSSDGGSSNVGAIVGGVVGGIAGLAVAAVVVFMVLKHRKKQTKSAGSEAPTHAPSMKAGTGAGPIPVGAVASLRDEAYATGFNSSPRSNVTPRHVLVRQGSCDHTAVNM